MTTAGGDRGQLTAQVKLLLKTEQRLHRSQHLLDAQLQRLQAFCAFALEASRSRAVAEIVERTVDLLWRTCGVQAALALVRPPRAEGPRRALLRAGDGALEPLAPPGGEAGPAPLRWEAWAGAVQCLEAGEEGGACRGALALLDAAAPADAWELRAPWRSRLILPLGRGPEGDRAGVLLLCRCAATRVPAAAGLDGRSFLELVCSHASAAVEVSSLNTELEERVEERTRELAVANERLRRGMESLTEAQARLVQISRLAAIGELAARVAHEINNPLAVLKADAAWLSSGGWEQVEEEERAEVMAEVVQAVERIATSVGRLRAEAGEAAEEAGAEPEG